jgi:hypothetical protein
MGLLLRWRYSLVVCTFLSPGIVPFSGKVLTSWACTALSTIPALLYTFLERGIGLNTTVLGARYGGILSIYDFVTNYLVQHMGLHSHCHGGRQDV